jgi:hypothetical protein
VNLETIQQLVRIVLYAAGGTLLGNGIADGELFQQVLGASGAIVAFVWWLVFERNRLAGK